MILFSGVRSMETTLSLVTINLLYLSSPSRSKNSDQVVSFYTRLSNQGSTLVHWPFALCCHLLWVCFAGISRRLGSIWLGQKRVMPFTRS